MTGKHIRWQPIYGPGIEDIGFQHHNFLNLIKRLSDEPRMTTGPSRRTALISELNAYAALLVWPLLAVTAVFVATAFSEPERTRQPRQPTSAE